MLKRLRSTGLAGGGAMLLVLSLSGVVAAATVLTALTAPVVDPTVPPVVAGTTTFVDADGNGVDDSCQTNVVADPVAAASAEVAADLNGDGQISVTEAARSGRTGGKNCNHGGYVSSVAHATNQTCTGTAPVDATQPADTTDSADTTQQGDANEQGDEVDTAETTTTVTTTCTETQTTDTTVPVVCPPAPVTTTPVTTTTDTTVPAVDLGPNAHGKAVSKVAHSTDVGGKNCNHGGAVSAAAHDTAARDAAKAARDAAKAAKQLNKQHGKHHNG